MLQKLQKRIFGRYLLFFLLFHLNSTVLKAQTIVLPEQCDCDTSFVLNDTSLVIGKDTLELAHSIYTGSGTTPTNTQVEITNKLHFDSTTLVLDAQKGSAGIGTSNPASGAILELNAADKALLLTRTTPAALGTNALNGMIIYDTNENCLKAFEAGAWSNCLGSGNITVPTGTCSMFASGARKVYNWEHIGGGYDVATVASTDGFLYDQNGLVGQRELPISNSKTLTAINSFDAASGNAGFLQGVVSVFLLNSSTGLNHYPGTFGLAKDGHIYGNTKILTTCWSFNSNLKYPLIYGPETPVTNSCVAANHSLSIVNKEEYYTNLGLTPVKFERILYNFVKNNRTASSSSGLYRMWAVGTDGKIYSWGSRQTNSYSTVGNGPMTTRALTQAQARRPVNNTIESGTPLEATDITAKINEFSTSFYFDPSPYLSAQLKSFIDRGGASTNQSSYPYYLTTDSVINIFTTISSPNFARIQLPTGVKPLNLIDYATSALGRVLGSDGKIYQFSLSPSSATLQLSSADVIFADPNLKIVDVYFPNWILLENGELYYTTETTNTNISGTATNKTVEQGYPLLKRILSDYDDESNNDVLIMETADDNIIKIRQAGTGDFGTQITFDNDGNFNGPDANYSLMTNCNTILK